MTETEPIDVAVLDVNLNGEMSYPIADALAARGVPFVFVTGYDKDRMLDGYRCFPVLQKPFHRSELSDTLAKMLRPTNVESSPAGESSCRLHDLQVLCRCLAFVGYFFVLNRLPY